MSRLKDNHLNLKCKVFTNSIGGSTKNNIFISERHNTDLKSTIMKRKGLFFLLLSVGITVVILPSKAIAEGKPCRETGTLKSNRTPSGWPICSCAYGGSALGTKCDSFKEGESCQEILCK